VIDVPIQIFSGDLTVFINVYTIKGVVGLGKTCRFKGDGHTSHLGL
jgi:hypothetical protein